MNQHDQRYRSEHAPQAPSFREIPRLPRGAHMALSDGEVARDLLVRGEAFTEQHPLRMTDDQLMKLLVASRDCPVVNAAINAMRCGQPMTATLVDLVLALVRAKTELSRLALSRALLDPGPVVFDNTDKPTSRPR